MPDDNKDREHMLRAGIKMTITQLVDHTIEFFNVGAAVCKQINQPEKQI